MSDAKVYALVLNGAVHEVFPVDVVPPLDAGLPLVDVTAIPGIAPGWVAAADGSFSAPVYFTVTRLIPTTISRRQFWQQLAVDGDITEDEALAAIDGVIPDKLAKAIDALPDDAMRFSAKMLLKGAGDFLRSNPMVDVLAAPAALNRDAAALDVFWIAAAAL